jgi:hypothetical protein
MAPVFLRGHASTRGRYIRPHQTVGGGHSGSKADVRANAKTLQHGGEFLCADVVLTDGQLPRLRTMGKRRCHRGEETAMRRNKYLILILTLVVVLIAESWVRRSFFAWVSDFLIFVLALAVLLVVFERRWERILAYVAAVAALAFSFSRYFAIPEQLIDTQAVIYHVLMAAFLGFAVAIVLRNIFETKAITRDDVLGTICGYMLAAGAWSSIYSAIAIVAPDAFNVPEDLRGFLNTADRVALFDYFSVVTLTTMGYGDITPARPPATSFAMLEAIFGQFYIAIVVAQLVGLRLAQTRASGDSLPR